MAEKRIDGPTLVPAAHERTSVLDRAHLARMTFGDAKLEREVLHLFVRQAEALLKELDTSRPEAVAALAHRMKGSAKGVGAWNVAAAAEMIERTALADPQALAADVAALGEAIEDVRRAAEQALQTS